MEKILVTTDFSANSKAALRFAIQLASQNKFDLTFFHSYYVLIPTSWSNNKISEYKKIEEKKIQNKLDRFVKMMYTNMGINSSKFACVIKALLLPRSTFGNMQPKINLALSVQVQQVLENLKDYLELLLQNLSKNLMFL